MGKSTYTEISEFSEPPLQNICDRTLLQWCCWPRFSILLQKGLHCRFFPVKFAEFYETVIIECLWIAAFRCDRISYYPYSILCNHTIKNTGNKAIFWPNWLKMCKKFISCWKLVYIPFASLLYCYFFVIDDQFHRVSSDFWQHSFCSWSIFPYTLPTIIV